MVIKNILALTILLSTGMTGVAQSLEKILDKEVPITWLGLDFSGAKLMADRDKYGSLSDIQYLLKSWNDLIEKEKDRYNIARFTQKKTAVYHADIARAHNDGLDVSLMLSDVKTDNVHFKKEDITTLVNTYNFESLTGIGLLFIVESLSEFHHQAAVWATFIDLSTKEVIATVRIIAGPGGPGFRNYWAHSFLEAIERMERQIAVWRKENTH